MPHMAQFVYDFYWGKIQRLQASRGHQRQMQAELAKPPVSREPRPAKPAGCEQPKPPGIPAEVQAIGETSKPQEEEAMEEGSSNKATKERPGERRIRRWKI
ncbi:uncharacterized protein LOC119741395 [Patiria miniata]|uniref:Uncharacterized protein n=1 Tax=Patiria miniata TaxID=46514 RepID=A0A914BAF8_PATMI|nr:uncharacterized protein LOC119741395 [Patiria miniata]